MADRDPAARLRRDGPDAPSDDVPDITGYLVGMSRVCWFVGRFLGPCGVLVPPTPPRRDRHVRGAGPAGDDTAHAHEAPENSVAGAPLAYEIKVGDVWTKLNNHLVIRYGLETGLLELVHFEIGGPRGAESCCSPRTSTS